MTKTASCRACDTSPNYICAACLTAEIATAPPLPDSAVALLRATGLGRHLSQQVTDAAA